MIWSAYSSDSRRWAHLASLCIHERLRLNQGCVEQRAPHVNEVELASCSAIVCNAKPGRLALRASIWRCACLYRVVSLHVFLQHLGSWQRAPQAPLGGLQSAVCLVVEASVVRGWCLLLEAYSPPC